MKRRKFLVSLAGLAAVTCGRSNPDLILHRGHIITVDPKKPRAQALAIIGDRILAVGSDSAIIGLAGPDTRKIDLEGRTVVPGFIDAHTHPAYAGRYHLRYIDCDLRSIKAIQESVRKKAAATKKGEWVLGFKYDDTKTAEKRFITRADLDAAAPDHPVFIVHRGGHTAYVNSLALKLARVSEYTPDPKGGGFGRDPSSGRLTGRLLETGKEPFNKIIPSDFSREDNRQAVKLVTGMMSRAGITSATDAYGSPDDLLAYQDARDASELNVRTCCMIGSDHFDKMAAAGIKTGFGDRWVRVGAMKLTCDGSISERTARLTKPYVGRPDDFGIIVMDEEELYARARKAHLADWQIGIHANGDAGIDISLRVYERLQREYRRTDPRFRLEHCTVINKNLLRRIRALGAIPTPFSTYVYFHGEKMKEYGPARLERMFALRSFLNAGIRPTQASDYPPGPFEPMMALQSSVTRTDMNGIIWGPSQKISVEEAIKVGTINGAYASFEEDIKGSLEAGKLADLVVLGKDPTKVDPGTLIDIPVERTMVGGNWVWES
jgi:predicted amidohydrolase YtcJ